MIRFFAGTVVGAALLLLCLTHTYAQGNTVDETTFWERLQQTDQLLTQALALPDSQRNSAPILSLWSGIQHVHLAVPSGGDSSIDVDMRWITVPVSSGDTAALKSVQVQVSALLAYHARGGSTRSAVSLDKLSTILKDPRFNYAEPTPTPTPTPPNPDNGGLSIPTIPAGLAQALLGAIGVVAVVVVIAYFFRQVRTQGRFLDVAAVAPDDPTTAQNALERASDRAASHDYRSAIRYLYLASLLRLNERGVISYNATLTNREHLAQVTDRPQLLELLRQIVATFEEAWYGYVPVSQSAYDDYQQRIEQLWRMVT